MLYILTKLYFEGTAKPATRQKITSYFFPVSPVTECDKDLVVDSNQKSEDDEKDIDRYIGNKGLESIGFEDGEPDNDDFEGKGSEMQKFKTKKRKMKVFGTKSLEIRSSKCKR